MTKKAVVNVATLATLVAAFITDVLAPLGSFTRYVVLATVALLFTVVVASRRFAPRIHALGQRRLPGYWRAPLLLTLGFSFCLLVAAHFVTESAPAGGWVASQVPALGNLQQQLGVVDARTEEISETTKSIKKDTEEIKATLEGVKKESSDDPRKELANIGVAWSTGSFVDALKTGDARVVRLFLSGGMSPAVLHGNASAVIYMLQPRLPDPAPMLQLMVDAGFDLNANLHDGLIMRDYGLSMPPPFESPDLPTGYIGHGTFDGPALLWLSIRSSYGVTEQWDLDTIAFLRRNGANTKLTRQYLDSLEGAWGGTEPYEKVRAALE